MNCHCIARDLHKCLYMKANNSKWGCNNMRVIKYWQWTVPLSLILNIRIDCCVWCSFSLLVWINTLLSDRMGFLLLTITVFYYLGQAEWSCNRVKRHNSNVVLQMCFSVMVGTFKVYELWIFALPQLYFHLPSCVGTSTMALDVSVQSSALKWGCVGSDGARLVFSHMWVCGCKWYPRGNVGRERRMRFFLFSFFITLILSMIKSY